MKKRYRPRGKRSKKVNYSTRSARIDSNTFSGFITNKIKEKPQSADRSILRSSPLAHLEYEDELDLKNSSFKQFYNYHKLPGNPEDVIASPYPRHYRTTSKRRTICKGSKLYLFLGDRTDLSNKQPFIESPLEPQVHTDIYCLLQKKVSEKNYKVVANHLNYLIIRGNYFEQSVIFNIDNINGPIVKKLKALTALLIKQIPSVTGVYIYTDPTCSDYYLEERRPENLLHFKKLHGRPYIKVTHNKCRYHFHPTSFSQVNESIVSLMLEKTIEILAPTSDQLLIDLYCGYGLFSHYLAPHYNKLIGIDAEGPSIRSAIANKKLNSGSRNTKFLAHRITGDILGKVLPPPKSSKETVILDPPRQGPYHDVIEAIASRKPHKVLHVHCATEQIPISVKAWLTHGYSVERVVPFDMFPGSANLEVLIYLKQSRNSN